MNEHKTIEERYATATTTSHLIVDSDNHSCDVLVAAGMAGQKNELALAMWSLAHMPSRSRMMELREQIRRRVKGYMDRRGMKGKHDRIADAVLAWWMKPACPDCDGLGYEKYPNAPALSDVPCSSCGGTGKRQLKSDCPEAARWMAAELESLAAKATDSIKAKLI